VRITDRLKYSLNPLLLSLIFVFTIVHPCSATQALKIPEQLKPWMDWVLHDKQEQVSCIPEYNDADIYHCSWPSTLKVRLTDTGGEFTQFWLIHSQTWVPLPGNHNRWPRDVKVDGNKIIIIEKNKIPHIQLSPGGHAITGRFTWSGLPENLQIPSQSGLVYLTVNNEKIKFPNLDGAGRLWLKRLRVEEKIENRLKIESFRLIEDSIPATVLLYITLDVAGSARQITLGPLYSPKQFTPVSLNSTLPAWMEQDGKMQMQVRPGRYNVRVSLRHEGPLSTFLFHPPDQGLWPQQEIWSFKAQPDLRLVELTGAPSIDPLQTSMPEAWHKFPAYRLLPGEFMQFKEIKRGDPHPAPDQLTLDRTLWLRFDGTGVTIQDKIIGVKNTNWRLEIDPAIGLGRVAVDGKEQVITRQKGSDKVGVELRNGRLNLTADSLLKGKISSLPATGWDHDFQKVKGQLHLPPGWKLLNATGIDNIPRTWVKRWTLLDFFMVLIFTIALAKLFSTPLAGIAFITLVLTYHEPGAPRYVWPALLIGFTLLKYLPDGAFKKGVKLYQCITLLILVILFIPYAIHALRIGIYPQLERPWTSMTDYSQQQNASFSRSEQMDMADQMPEPKRKLRQEAMFSKDNRKKSGSGLTSQFLSPPPAYYDTKVMQHDPKALTQTGPGMPRWMPFETVNFSWSGPVTRDQMISFTLIGPKINLVLAFVRVLLILLLALGMLGFQYKPKQGFTFSGMKSLTAVSFMLMVLFIPYPANAGEIPSPQILEELQQRLLEKEDCYPACANMSDVFITITHDRLTVNARIDAQLPAAIPIPSHVKHWLPHDVMIDNAPAKGILQKDNRLWILMPAGIHRVTLGGPIRKQNTLQLPFPLKPHGVTIQADGWTVDGLHPDGTVDAQLQFKRIVEQTQKQTQILETGILPPFAMVERTLLLGLVWKIQTRVHRISPTESGMVLDIPLLPGESVTTPGIQVSKGVAKINLRADQKDLFWESFLEPTGQILLEHKRTGSWTEIWKVDVSPVFHLTYEGIPVILHKTGNRWYPTWHPWPGESVRLKISRPAGIAGQTLTIESSHLELRPGQKNTAAKLTLTVKSSQGGQHIIVLPPDGRLQEVKVKGRIQPVRQEGRNVALPITPGQQDFELKWLETAGITTQYQSSLIDLGAVSVNASVDVYLPASRWPLLIGGEQLMGPAVLFWSVLIIIILVAFGLSKTGWTPLKFHHWFLLGMGLSMSNLAAAILVVGWLLTLGFRKKGDTLAGHRFNLMQIAIALLTIAGVGSLVFAISQGLLGHPDMNIAGNGSNHALLRWYQDVSDPTLPRGWVFSIPMLTYRIAMLAWALWISFWLIGILKWGWEQFSSPKMWQHIPLRNKQRAEKTTRKEG
jgi:hypothetical protein